MLTNQQIETIVQRVCKWNAAAGNKAWWININLEKKLITEEYGEYSTAITKSDRLEMLDWLIDCFVVGIWTMYKAWMHPKEIVDIICKTINIAYYWSSEDMDDYIDGLYRYRFGFTNLVWGLKYITLETAPFINNLYWAFEHILDSNDSKFIKNEKWELVAIKDEDWKIQKWPNYFKPDLTPFIKNPNE